MRKGGKSMYVVYRDELGYVSEKVDEYGISICDGKAYINDKIIPITSLVGITENTDNVNRFCK